MEIIGIKVNHAGVIKLIKYNYLDKYNYLHKYIYFYKIYILLYNVYNKT